MGVVREIFKEKWLRSIQSILYMDFVNFHHFALIVNTYENELKYFILLIHLFSINYDSLLAKYLIRYRSHSSGALIEYAYSIKVTWQAYIWRYMKLSDLNAKRSNIRKWQGNCVLETSNCFSIATDAMVFVIWKTSYHFNRWISKLLVLSTIISRTSLCFSTQFFTTIFTIDHIRSEVYIEIHVLWSLLGTFNLNMQWDMLQWFFSMTNLH